MRFLRPCFIPLPAFTVFRKAVVFTNYLFQDFGSIFTQLLPGTKALLRRIPFAEENDETKEIEGLEIRVAFGDLWKESLSELSGGMVPCLVVAVLIKKQPRVRHK